jgi:hypothetical protein
MEDEDLFSLRPLGEVGHQPERLYDAGKCGRCA